MNIDLNLSLRHLKETAIDRLVEKIKTNGGSYEWVEGYEAAANCFGYLEIYNIKRISVVDGEYSKVVVEAADINPGRLKLSELSVEDIIGLIETMD